MWTRLKSRDLLLSESGLESSLPPRQGTQGGLKALAPQASNFPIVSPAAHIQHLIIEEILNV